jgi:hypothetical protein
MISHSTRNPLAWTKKLYVLGRTTVVSILLFALLGLIPFEITKTAHADTQLAQRPRDVRIGHLGSDPVAGRNDFIFREKVGATPSTITAYAPGGTLLFSIPPDPTQPIQELVDVVDMDNDGSAEIIGINGGDGASVAPVLYIYDGYGNQRTRFTFFSGMLLSSQMIKIYNLWPNTTLKRLVVAPSATGPSFTGFANNTFVYFFDSNGAILATPGVPQGPPGEFLGFPGVVVGDIDSSGGYDIFIVAKSRLLAFNQNGQKLYYKQFVDPGGSFTSYNTALDKPSGSSMIWSGRRYGMYQLIDVNGDGDQELVVAADKNLIVNNIPGAVYEAYNVTATAQPDGYIGKMWQTWIMNSSMDATITNNNPQGYQVGVSFDGIADVNGDGVPDIVLTERNASGNPVVRVINARTGAATGALINGICLDVRPFDSTQGNPDLMVYDPTTPHPVISGMGTHMIWRFNTGTYTPVRLTESPGNTLAAGAAVMLKEKFSIASTFNIGLNTGEGHFSVEPGRSAGVWSFAGYSSLNCPSALYSWTTTGGLVQRSLDIASRPGEVVDIVRYNSATNRLWLLNIETSCASTNIVRTATQSLNSTVARCNARSLVALPVESPCRALASPATRCPAQRPRLY